MAEDKTPKALSELGFHEIALEAFWDSEKNEPVYTDDIIRFRRLSEREREDFVKKRMCFIGELRDALFASTSWKAYKAFHDEMMDAIGQFCAEDKDRELLKQMGENPLVYRWALLALSGQFIKAEFVGDTSGLPDAEAVDEMTDQQVEALGNS